jgi:hypothetical protein
MYDVKYRMIRSLDYGKSRRPILVSFETFADNFQKVCFPSQAWGKRSMRDARQRSPADTEGEVDRIVQLRYRRPHGPALRLRARGRAWSYTPTCPASSVAPSYRMGLSAGDSGQPEYGKWMPSVAAQCSGGKSVKHEGATAVDQRGHMTRIGVSDCSGRLKVVIENGRKHHTRNALRQ